QRELPAKDLDKLWDDLAGADARRAYRAVWGLALAPGQAVPLLRGRLRPAPPADAGRGARLVAGRAGGRLGVRRQAMQELADRGPLAEPALRRALQDRPPLETRQRVEQLLQKLETPSGTALRALRSLEVLEHAGTPLAREL